MSRKANTMYLVVYCEDVYYQGESLIDAKNAIAEMVDDGTVSIEETESDVCLIEGQKLSFVATAAHTEVIITKP